MKKGRIKRNIGSIIIGLAITLLIFIFNFTPKKINNYTDVMSGILSFSSITTSLLFASFSLIPALPNSKLFKSLKELKTDKKFLDRLLLAIFGFLLCSVFALISLLFNERDGSIFSKIVVSITGGLLGFSISEQFKVLRILLKGLENI